MLVLSSGFDGPISPASRASPPARLVVLIPLLGVVAELPRLPDKKKGEKLEHCQSDGSLWRNWKRDL